MRIPAALRSVASAPDVLNRRRWLSTSGLQAAGLGAMSQFWNAVSQGAPLPAATSLATKTRRAKSVIMIFNCGAPSHIDLWDMKPQAPSEIRGSFEPIATNVPGIEISELLPEVAKRMDKLSIVRTLHHTHGGHNSGMHWSIVGKPYRIDSTLINPGRADVPCFGTLAGWPKRMAIQRMYRPM